MKIVAFNLASKVHRNELPFEEGILQSNAEGVAGDFIHALNSLACRIKYDPAQLPSLLHRAQAALGGQVVAAPPPVDLTVLQGEIDSLRTKKRRTEEEIETLRSICAQHEPMIVPGVNSILFLITWSVFVALLFIFDLSVFGLLTIVLGLAGAGLFYMTDSQTLQKQQEEAERRRAKNEAEVKRLEGSLGETCHRLEAKTAELRAARGGESIPVNVAVPS
jgi:hypothetical protein